MRSLEICAVQCISVCYVCVFVFMLAGVLVRAYVYVCAHRCVYVRVGMCTRVCVRARGYVRGLIGVSSLVIS